MRGLRREAGATHQVAHHSAHLSLIPATIPGRGARTTRAPLGPIFQMTEDRTDWIDELARESPSALTMALERAIATQNRDLERAVLLALGRLGIAVVDRSALADTITARRPIRTRTDESR